MTSWLAHRYGLEYEAAAAEVKAGLCVIMPQGQMVSNEVSYLTKDTSCSHAATCFLRSTRVPPDKCIGVHKRLAKGGGCNPCVPMCAACRWLLLRGPSTSHDQPLLRRGSRTSCLARAGESVQHSMAHSNYVHGLKCVAAAGWIQERDLCHSDLIGPM